MKTSAIAPRSPRSFALCAHAVLLAAGLACTMSATPVLAQAENYYNGVLIHSTRSPGGADGQNVTFNVPVLVDISLDLSGGNGLNGADGIHYPVPFVDGEWYTTASMGGHGGAGGSLTLNAGGTIALAGSERIDLQGGTGGQGGMSLNGYFGFGGPPNHRAPDGNNGQCGDLILNAPSQMTLTGSSMINSSTGPSSSFVDIPGANWYDDPILTTAGEFRAVGLNGRVTDNAWLWGFSDVTLDSASQLRLDSQSRFDVGHCTLRGGSSMRVEDSALALTARLNLSGSSSLTTYGGTFSAFDMNVDASVVSIQGGLVGVPEAGDAVFSNGSELRLTGGTLQLSGSRSAQSAYDSMLSIDAGLFQQTGGVFDGQTRSVLKGTNGATLNIFAGAFAIDGRPETGSLGATAINVVDSTLNIGSGGAGPSITIRTPLNKPAILLEGSTLNYNAGTLDINSSIKMDADSVFNVNAAALDAGFVSGSLDRSAGTVNVTDLYFTFGTSNALGRLLGGANTAIGTNFAVTGTTFIVNQTNLTVENGGRLTAGNVVGLGSSAFSFGPGFEVTTSALTSVNLNAGVITSARQANSSAAPVAQGSINLAQGTLGFLASEGGASPRETLKFTGGLSNGTVLIGASSNASILFKDVTGNAILNTGVTSPGVVVRVDNASFGGLSGGGRIQVAGPLTIATIGTNSYSAPLAGNGALTIAGNGEQQLLASSSFTGGATLRSGTLGMVHGALGSGVIAFDGGTLKALDFLTVTNQLRLDAGGGTISLNNFPSTVTLPIVKAPGTNDAGLTITGSGQLNLAANANYTGGTTIRDGALVRVPAATALGTGPVTLDAGTLRASGNIVSQNALRIGAIGATLDTGGSGNSITWTHDITDVPGQGSGSLFIQGGGTVVLNGVKSYSAITAVDNTTVSFNTPAALGTGPIIANNATLRSNGLFSLATMPLMISAGGVHIELNNSLLSWNNQVSPFFGGNGGLTLSGSGGLVLLQPNTYNGQTTITSGTLAAFNTTGSATGSGPILVDGGTLSGIGIYGIPAVQSNITMLAGAIAPGDGPQTLTFAHGGLMQLDGGEIQIDIGSASDLITFASLGDRLRGTGATLRLIPGDGFSPLNTYTIFDNVLDAGSLFSFASIVGVDPSLSPSVSYDAATRSYVVGFVPAPASLGLLLGAGLVASRRRR